MSPFFLLAVSLVGVAAPAPARDEGVSPRDRAMVTGALYASVQRSFAHGEGVPGYDLEKSWAHLLDQAFQAKGRYEFDLACIEFLAELGNGHSSFGDEWLVQNFGQPFGFHLGWVGDRWVVVSSRVPQLKVGDVVKAIDGEETEAFYQARRRYLHSSTEWSRRTRLTRQRYLFPPVFTVQLDGGRKVAIHRVAPVDEALKTESRWLEPGIGYLRVPSFGAPEFEKAALEQLQQFKDARSLILDLRGNDGGSTPDKLIDALMDRPYRGAASATPIAGAALFILIDRDVFSAAEDCSIPFKANGRATFVGEATGGSTGQPYLRRFPNGMWFRVSAKRDRFPDGAPFEGVGIWPDVEVPTTVAALRAGRDEVMARALELARKRLEGARATAQAGPQPPREASAQAKALPAPPTGGTASLPDALAPTGAAPGRASGDEADSCSSDSQCSLTRVAAGACCPTLCAPRPVTAQRAAELLRAAASCRGCAEPLCAPQRTTLRAVCSQHRCSAVVEPLE
jgi:carboxyl-terminal processing protease